MSEFTRDGQRESSEISGGCIEVVIESSVLIINIITLYIVPINSEILVRQNGFPVSSL
jgi:hypothetical protein